MQNDTLLCSNPRVTAESLADLVRDGDRGTIAAFIENRFIERYFAPIDALNSEQMNGFAIMALCCLTIEALQSFREGLESSGGQSRKLFKTFLSHDAGLSPFRDDADRFYVGVRCGILHQGETTGGWKIRRSGPLFDSTARYINATKFQKALRKSLAEYISELKREELDSEAWICCKKKLASIINNCNPSA
jgi:hypothetical protein